MSLRIRFALLFTISVAIILLFSSLAIYYFYSSNRKSDYKNKLKNEAMITFDGFIDSQLLKIDSSLKISNQFGNNFLQEEKVLIYSDDKKVILSKPEATNVKISTKTFSNIKEQKEYYYKVGYREFIGIYLETEQKYIVASAIDRDGLNRLIRLRFILLGVFLTGVFITAAISYFFVLSALKPLSVLSNQITQTTEKNLWQKKVDEGNGKDEIAQIAISYNAMMIRLKEAFEVQKNFVHHASHELRTPLAVMYAATEAALNKQLTETEYKKVLTSLKDDQNNLIELTNSLLLLSQFERLQLLPNGQSFRIDELIYDAIDYCKKIFPEVIIDFDFKNVPEENNLIINGNDTLLRAAFTNLIKNAFLYSTDKKLRIGLFANETEMLIHFDNTGDQLSETEVENMRTPFSRGENIGLVKGIGLGLSIVHKIIDLHKGSFNYFALPNHLNRFTIKLK